jgi:hypothetical protein
MPRLRATLAALALLGCNNAGEDLWLPPGPTGTVQVAVFFDRDGTGTLTTFDTVFRAARVALFTEGGIDTFMLANSRDDGLATFINVPVGRYRFDVVRATIGDSLPVLEGANLTFPIRADTLNRGAVVMVSYATLSLAEARAAAPGSRVFVHGIVASPMQVFTDQSTFLTDAGSHLRVVPSAHRPGRTGNNIGDSVIVLGVLAQEHGQPILRDGQVLTVGTRAPPTLTDVSVAEVASARGGALDAALVQAARAEIADTATVGTDFHVRIATDTDTATVVFDATLQVAKTSFVPGREMTARGVLVPVAPGTWILKPRPVAGEVVLH